MTRFTDYLRIQSRRPTAELVDNPDCGQDAPQAIGKRLGRSRGVSATEALMWRVIAHGTAPGKAHGLFLAWPGWERIAHRLWPTMPIPDSPYGLLRVRFRPYRGEPIILPDGYGLRPGSVIGELHCENRSILDLVAHAGINPFRACREDLRSLARWLERSDCEESIGGFFGWTLLSRAACRLGFIVRPRPPTVRARLDRVFFAGLLMLYTVDGLDRLHRGSTISTYPQEVWMSRKQLIRRYGTPQEESGAALDPA
jgi:hypothetical protein